MNNRISPPGRCQNTTALVVTALLAVACNDKNEGIEGSLKFGMRFTDVHTSAGLDYEHTYRRDRSEYLPIACGVAAGDYDRDGFTDLYISKGDNGGNVLFRNKGDGTFEDVSDGAGVRLAGGAWCGSTFADINGDLYLDIFIGGVAGTPPCILINQQDGTFADRTPGSGLDVVRSETYSAAFGDYDKDGDLDLFLTQWNTDRGPGENSQNLWENDGTGVFTDVSIASGVTEALEEEDEEPGGPFTDYSFTPNFVDVDSDGWLDLVITSDEGKNLVLVNNKVGGFENITESVVSSPHATGAAMGDYDNDGDVDWFASGLYYDLPGAGFTGNRLYSNQGNGTFQDLTDTAGVRDGSWGWASSFADFNNDGNLDLVQVNGYGVHPNGDFNQFFRDPSRLFMNNGNGTFAEEAADLRFDDFLLGRGVVCFDYDRDGDIDIFVANVFGEPALWRNDGGNSQNFLTVGLEFLPGNYRGIGSRITITINGEEQMRELRGGSHYVSQNPVEAHFGLGDADVVDMVEIRWPDGTTTIRTDVPANQILRISR